MELLTIVEYVAVAFGFASVYFTVKQSNWLWPTGIVMVALYAYIFYEVKLYSDAILQLIYFVLQIWGWRKWYKGANDKKLPIRTLSWYQRASWAVLIVLGTAAWGGFMATKTDAAFPYADALIVVMSLVAQGLLAFKFLENWWLWIAVDVV